MTNKEAQLKLLLQGWSYYEETDDNFALFKKETGEAIFIFVDGLNTYKGDASNTVEYDNNDLTNHKEVEFNSIVECVEWLETNDL